MSSKLSLHKLQNGKKKNGRIKRVVIKYNKEIIMHLRARVMERVDTLSEWFV